MKTYVFTSRHGNIMISLTAENEGDAWDNLAELLKQQLPQQYWYLLRTIDPGQDILDNLFNKP